MANLTTADVAAALDITPKVLRRFLRADPMYVNAGNGGRYSFTTADLTQLRKRFAAWSTKKSPASSGTRKRVTVSADDGLALELLLPVHRQTSEQRRAIDELTRERNERLQALLNNVHTPITS